MSDQKPYPHLVRKRVIEAEAFHFKHPWNPDSEISGTQMSKLGGLERTTFRTPSTRNSST